MQKHAQRFPFEKLITHRLSLEELVRDMRIVTDPDACMKVEVIPHKK
jgi:hypothetical protein